MGLKLKGHLYYFYSSGSAVAAVAQFSGAVRGFSEFRHFPSKLNNGTIAIF